MARWTAGPAPVLTLALLLTTFGPGPAAAGGYPEAEKAYSMGRLLVDLGDTTRGLFELKRAAAIVPSPRYVEAIVKVYRDLGKDEQALAWGERYLDMTTPEEQDEALAAWLGQVRERLRASRGRVALRVFPEDARLEYTAEDGTVRAGVPDGDDGRMVWWLLPGRGTLSVHKDGWAAESRELVLEAGASEELSVTLVRAVGEGDLIVESSVAGAEVRIEGQVAGLAPLQVSKPAGRYVIQVWAKNHADWTGFATVTPEKATRVQVYLTRAPGAVAPARQTIQWKPANRGLGLSGWGWITMGLGVAMGGTAGYTGWASFDRVDKAQKYNAGTPERKKLAQEVQTYWAATLALGSVGGAAVAGGLLMVLLDDRGDRDKEATLEMLSFAPEITPDGFTLNSMITF
ncbi:MAG: PEGA domain-containing protein [Pseudomonadota bacterium]